MADEPAALELVVNPTTRIVHRSSCYYAGILQLAEPMPLDDWPEDARGQLRGCDHCQPPGVRELVVRRREA